jgi:hypothetical protein
MSSLKWTLLSFFGCGIAFWTSDLIIAALDRNDQGGAAAILCPIGLIAAYFLVLRVRKSEPSGPSTAIFAIWGMWVLALSFVLLAQKIRSEKGIGFGWDELGYLLTSSFMPTRIFLFVGLEGSLIGLLLATVAMIICHFTLERTRWILPPSIWALLRHSKQ